MLLASASVKAARHLCTILKGDALDGLELILTNYFHIKRPQPPHKVREGYFSFTGFAVYIGLSKKLYYQSHKSPNVKFQQI